MKDALGYPLVYGATVQLNCRVIGGGAYVAITPLAEPSGPVQAMEVPAETLIRTDGVRQEKQKVGEYNFPRRIQRDHWTPEERAFQDLIDKVEALGAHSILTHVVTMLGDAKEFLLDWIERPKE